MSSQAGPNQLEQDIASAVETAIAKRPVLKTILQPFAEVLTAKARLAAELEPALAAKELTVDPSRLSNGIPLLAGMAFDDCRDELSQSLNTMLSVLKKVFSPIEADLSLILSAHTGGNLKLAEIARAYLDGETALLRTAAKAAQVHEDILGLAVSTALSPVLTAMVPTLRAHPALRSWHAGHCPICGSMPSVSYLAPADLQSEFLKGGGGQRYLHCSMCGFDWHVMRNTCPACESAQNDRHFYFQVEGERAERVDVCQNCGAYLPCIDLRETAWKPPMDIAAVSMVHLDYWAAERGYHPLSQTPWNLFGPSGENVEPSDPSEHLGS